MTFANVVVYFKEGCDLCDAVIAELIELQSSLESDQSFTIERRDIEDCTEWYEAYRYLVPVVHVNDREVCHYHLDPVKVLEALK